MYEPTTTLFLFIFLFTLISAGVHIACLKNRNPKHTLTIAIRWTLGYAGIINIIKCYIHLFHPQIYAGFFGWETSIPWQYDIAIAHLMVGILGFFSIWIHGSFWTATIIVMTIRDWGFAIGHYIQLIFHYNFSIGNTGIITYLEVIQPMIAIALFIAYCNVKKFPQNL